MQENNYDLESRFVDYTCSMIDIVEALPSTRAGVYMSELLVKAAHAPTFGYADKQIMGSKNDFIVMLSRVLKDLKECRTALKIIRKKEMIKPLAKLEAVFSETEQLIAIIGKSISTAKKGKAKEELVD